MNRRARERIIAMEMLKLERRQALERAARPPADRTDAPERARGHAGERERRRDGGPATA